MVPTGLLFRLGLSYVGGAALKRLLQAAQTPERSQLETLQRILGRDRDTAFGCDHGFSEIRTVADFRARVPLQSYEDIRPYIERQMLGESALVAEKPLMYARTSGTLSAPKLIPVTPSALKRTRKVQAAISYVQMQACDLFSGKILVLAGAKREDSLNDGTPVGSVTGLIYETMPRSIQRQYIVPPEVFSIDDARLKYAIVAHLALMHDDLSAVSTANPSTFLRLRDYFQQNWMAMIADVRRGHIDGIKALPADIYRAVKKTLRPAPERAEQLDHLSELDQTTIGDLWPNLRGVVTWTGGSCAIAAEAVRRALPAHTHLIEAGYVASELRGTAVVDVARNLALPVLEDVFFEFIAVEDWDQGKGDTLLLHELDDERDYQIIVTTQNGLFRYVMNDIVRTGPRIAATPSLRFQRKAKGFTSITGEKLSEEQVAEAMVRLGRETDGEIRFYVCLADEAEGRYRLYLHRHPDDPALPPVTADLATAFDRHLAAINIEYAAKRDTQRLNPPLVLTLKPETALAFRDFHIGRGQREAQFKALTLQYVRECPFDFTPWLEDIGS